MKLKVIATSTLLLSPFAEIEDALTIGLKQRTISAVDSIQTAGQTHKKKNDHFLQMTVLL